MTLPVHEKVEQRKTGVGRYGRTFTMLKKKREKRREINPKTTVSLDVYKVTQLTRAKKLSCNLLNEPPQSMHVRDSWAEARSEAITLSKKSNRRKQRNQEV